MGFCWLWIEILQNCVDTSNFFIINTGASLGFRINGCQARSYFMPKTDLKLYFWVISGVFPEIFWLPKDISKIWWVLWTIAANDQVSFVIYLLSFGFLLPLFWHFLTKFCLKALNRSPQLYQVYHIFCLLMFELPRNKIS